MELVSSVDSLDLHIAVDELFLLRRALIFDQRKLQKDVFMENKVLLGVYHRF